MVVPKSNPNTGEGETGGTLGLAGQSTLLELSSSRPMKDSVSKNMNSH